MAIPCSSSSCRSLSYFHHPSPRKSDKTPFSSSYKLTSFYSPQPWSKTSPFFILNSTISSPSSILDQEEESSSSSSTSSSRALPVLELSFKATAATANSMYTPRTQAESLNKFILDLLKNPDTQELALEIYKKSRADREFQPQKSTITSLMKYLVRTKKWDSVSSLCNDLKIYGVIPDSITCSRLISSCIKARKFKVVDLMLEVFKSSDNKDTAAVSAFDSAMRGYNKLHMYSSTVGVFERMKQSGLLVLDSAIYRLVMEAYMKLGNSEKVVELFVELEAGDKLDSTLNSTQVYAILLEALGKSGKAFEALEYFKQMTIKEIPPNAAIYSSLICSFAEIREIEVAEMLTKEAEEKQMLKDPALFLKLVLMYVKEKTLDKTLNVIELMQSANIKVSDCIFCAIVNGFAKQRGLKPAANVYEELVSKGIEPGQVTYASILNVYCRLGLYTKSEALFQEMENKGYDKCVVAYSSMIVMYGKTGKLKEATKLVAKMKERGCEPNVWIYNALIDLHGRVQDLRQVDKVWKEMKRRKVIPDRVSYTSVISAYSKAREYEKCIQFYREFRMNGGVIDRVMAGIMVGVFSKSRVDELVKLLQDMKSEGAKMDARLYRSAFYALRDAGLEVQAKQLKESFHVNTSRVPSVKRMPPRVLDVPQ